ncbi:MAG TPA: carboxymuconolactone decarboxylase family protein [Solirubrobacteraceae bacterium]|nr:carboxymuconolactone decarboxylase family protein [Solirubrobacteraceae bacterium]
MRLPKLSEEQMTPRQRELSARIAGRRGQTRGPFLIWLHSPELCERVEALGAYARFESSLELRLRELVLLIAARHFDAQYSWNAHVVKAAEAGVDADALQRLARREDPAFGPRDERVLHAFCSELLEDHWVSDETFAQALELFGNQGVVDIVGSLGNYSMLAMLLNAFEVDLQADREPPFADVGREPRKVRSRLAGAAETVG